jgi:hypothetical protein
MTLTNRLDRGASIEGMDAAARDLRFAARLLLRNPGVTAITVICLALGMGATTAVLMAVAM